MIKAVVFDLDDTLYPEHTYVDSGFKAVDQYLAVNYKIDGFYEIATRLFTDGHRGKIFNEALDCLAFSYQDKLIKELIEVYRNHKPAIQLDTETTKVLEYFSQHYQTALITDGYTAAQRNKIEALRISRYFDFICVTDEFGRDYWKPHEKPFVATENVLKVKSPECVYIADNPVKDFVTPNRLGWKTIQLVSDNGEYRTLAVEPQYEAQFQVTGLSETLGLLEAS
ncbi:HAD family hydrolase [Endozoicomonas ascidiicola]|uniref:HAD family hydrolase n=1 Tax=Endozoicomonas ascidiicola TaxID=1698521 RepID=UPI0008324080|nr:HAD-IA family hydrolase [Endozoicomonas ascidiicola]